MGDTFSATNAASSGIQLDRKVIKELCRRSDRPGLVFLAKWITSLIATGYLVYLSMGSPWLWPAMFVYGTAISLPAYAMSHESAHGTAFRTRWINEIVFWITSLIYMEEPLHRRYTHTNHHTYTWHVGKDSQMPFDTPVTLRVWLLEITGIALTYFHLLTLLRLVSGRYTEIMKWVIPQNEFPRIRRNAFIFVGIYGGYATIAEAAGLAAFLSIVVSLFVYRGCSFGEVIPITAVALRRSAAIIMIVVAALLFGHWLTETRMPAKLVEFVTEIDLKAWQFLLIMSAIMLILGTVLEGLSIVLITVPLVLPLLHQFNIDPVHYAIIVVINIEMAMLTPPVGLNLFVLSSVSKAPVSEVIKGILPFLVLMLILLLAVTFLPALSLFLPSFVLG